jgi:tetratricopeptide (TPR) repeat protein
MNNLNFPRFIKGFKIFFTVLFVKFCLIVVIIFLNSPVSGQTTAGRNSQKRLTPEQRAILSLKQEINKTQRAMNLLYKKMKELEKKSDSQEIQKMQKAMNMLYREIKKLRVEADSLKELKSILEEKLDIRGKSPGVNKGIKVGEKGGSAVGISALPSEESPEIMRMFQISKEYRESGENKKAVDVLFDILSEDPKNLRAHLMLGEIFKNTGRLNEARNSYKELTRIWPELAVGWHRLGVIDMEMGKFEESRYVLQYASGIDPTDLEVQIDIGFLLLNIDNPDSAITVFTGVLQMEPTLARAYYGRGVAEKQLGKIETAKTDFQEAVTRNPDYAEAHYELGEIYLSDGMISYAIYSFQQATRLNPQDERFWFGLGSVYWQANDMEQSIQAWEQARELRPDWSVVRTWLPQAYYLQGINYFNEGDFKKATEYYQKAVKINPDSEDWLPQALYQAGIKYRKMGELKKAEESYLKALQLNPEFADGYFALGVIYWQTERFQDALNAWEKALLFDPDHLQAKGWIPIAKERLGIK